MKTILLKITLLLTLILNGCIYIDVKSPLDKNVSNTVIGDKVGTSKAYSVLWLFAWGDAGTASAAKNGGIKTISHLDARYQSYFFGAYSQRETIAYGD